MLQGHARCIVMLGRHRILLHLRRRHRPHNVLPRGVRIERGGDDPHDPYSATSQFAVSAMVEEPAWGVRRARRR